MAINKTTSVNNVGDARILAALSGESLYGDDFSREEIEGWYQAEKRGYYELISERRFSADTRYEFEQLAIQHCYSWLPSRSFNSVLGIGSALGQELDPILDRSGEIKILEPADGFHSKTIKGKSVEYVAPQASGLMPFESEQFDLVVAFSVLHHIPNVSTVLREMSRVLRPGGYVLLREPTHSMGDWRRARRGLTANERGIPIKIFDDFVQSAGLKIMHRTKCVFAPITRLQRVFPRSIWTYAGLVKIDAWLCRFPLWSEKYHATGFFQKIRPTSVCYVACKPGAELS